MRLQILGNSLLVEGVTGKRKIRGVAIHPMKTYHPQEWAKVRKYMDEYLEKAAPTLIGKPLIIDHSTTLPAGNRVIEAKWNPQFSRLEYVAEVTEDVAQKIQNGQIKGVSVGIDWQHVGGGVIITPEGVIPYNFAFEELSLLQNLEPGDPLATVNLWEGLVGGQFVTAEDIWVLVREAVKEALENREDPSKIQPTEFILHVIEPLEHFSPDFMQANWIDEENGVQGLFGRAADSESQHLFALCFLKGSGWDSTKIDTWLQDHPQYQPEAQQFEILKQGKILYRVPKKSRQGILTGKAAAAFISRETKGE